MGTLWKSQSAANLLEMARHFRQSASETADENYTGMFLRAAKALEDRACAVRVARI
jgi:hypothetical protein